MEFKNLNVLIDAYNLKLTQGSGIKTYVETLLKALQILGVNVSLLFDKNGIRKHVNPLDTILLFDQNIKENEIKDMRHSEKLYVLKKSFEIAIGRYKLRRIFIDDKVIVPNSMDFFHQCKDIFNIAECYRVSKILFNFANIIPKFSLPKQIDIWHATFPLPINIKGIKKITTVHDLVPLKLPYTCRDNKRFFYNNVKKSLHDSSLIITVSQNTKKDILDFYDINPDKIYTTYEGISSKPHFSEEEIIYSLKTYNLEFKKYILFVGNIEPKKNIGRLIDAFSRIKIGFPLVIVGRKAWLWENELKKTNILIEGKRLKMLDYVHKYDLDILYSGALIFVFPSLYEGFGLPPLEAMSCNCPVITSNVASLPEVCGDAALFVNPYDINDIRDKIELLSDDEKLRNQLIEKGRKRVEFFSMENYIKRVYEAYSEIL